MQQRSVLSTKNKYWIPKFRYLELKNFCLQYPEWKTELRTLTPLKAHLPNLSSGKISDPTNDFSIRRMHLEEKISLIESVATLADPTIAKWIIKGVTESYSYDYLHLKLDLPAGRDMYYDRYRKFFWILDQMR